MISVPGYKITKKLYDACKTYILLGYSENTSETVLIETLKGEKPAVEDIDKLKNIYEITNKIDNVDSILKIKDFIKFNNNAALIIDYIDGESLKSYIDKNDIDIETFLKIAIKLAEILDDIHNNNVIHYNIHPGIIIISDNLTYDNSDQSLKITLAGFGRNQFQYNIDYGEMPEDKSDVLQIPLQYISPEQTGRFNRAVDNRSDLYSLGIVLYEMITGKVPFNSDDALDLIHSHIAREPEEPESIREDIPTVISAIIMKLLSKDADMRYQSARGLKDDLEKCLVQLEKNGKIDPFVPGTTDISGRLNFSQKLYGRDKEREQIVRCLDRVRGGANELMLVSGYAGVGKTALINEIYNPVNSGSGYFVKGKFDQITKHVPYGAIIQAFQLIIKKILTEREEVIIKWKKRIHDALIPNARLIIDVIPELEVLLGEKPPVPEVGALESKNRFNLYFQKFVKVFIQDKTPLVLFFDDIQWADIASLDMIKNLVTDPDIKYLFIICAYRDNEVDETHPVKIILEELKRENENIENIKLAPIGKDAVNRFISESLKCPVSRVKSLTNVVFQKTRGNPFYIIEFLKIINKNGLLFFNSDKGWQWDIKKLKEMPVSDNVVDLLKVKIKGLPADIRNLITCASCIGNSFSLNILKEIYKNTLEDILEIIKELKSEGFLIQEGDSFYRFIHDKIQEAAYSLLPDKKKKDLHYKIGRIFLEVYGEDKSGENLFTITDQLNLAHNRIKNKKDKKSLINYNLMAGKRAKKSAAFQQALLYLRNSRDLLFSLETSVEEEEEKVGKTRERHYKLYIDVIRDLAEAEYLNGNFSESERIILSTIPHLKSVLEKAELYNILIMQYTMAGKNLKAINAGKEIFRLLAVDIKEIVDLEELHNEILRVRDYLYNGRIVPIEEMPLMRDPIKIITAKLLRNLILIAYLYYKELYLSLITSLIDLSLEHGLISDVSTAFSSFGNIVGLFLGDYKSAYKFGEISLRVSEVTGDYTRKCEDCHHLGNFIVPWLKHIRESERLNYDGLKAGLETGELKFTGYIYVHINNNKFFQGYNLARMLSELDVGELYNRKTSNIIPADMFTIFRPLFMYYTGNSRSNNYKDFLKKEFNESKFVLNLTGNNNYTVLCQYHIFKLQLLYLHEDYREAIKSAEKAEELIEYYIGGIMLGHLNFYYSLSLTAIYTEADDTEQKACLEKLHKNQSQMKLWSDNCSENFFHKYLLVEAEIARIQSRDLEAMDLYDKAIDAAKDNEYVNNAALAGELAAKFWRGKGKENFARLYIEDAYRGYERWGIKPKLISIEEKFPGVFRKNYDEEEKPDAGVSLSFRLDHDSILRASQALSGEIQIDKLIRKLNRLALQNSGAERFFLIMEKKGKLFIESEAGIDKEKDDVLNSIPFEKYDNIPASVIHYVWRTGEDVSINNASEEGMFVHDTYIKKEKIKSILCTKRQSGKTHVIIYLENNLAPGAFTPERTEVLRIIATQAAIAIDNARLYTEQEIALKKLQKLDRLKDRLIKRNEESKYKILQERMNPHFMFNAINTIHSFINVDSEKADNAIIILANIYRFLMDKSFSLLIPFNEEWQFVRDYLEFERLRFPDTLNYEIKTSGNFNDISIPPLTIQPLVENSIKHGLRQKSTPGFIRVEARKRKESVVIEIIDNGVGLNTGNLFSRTLGNIRDRLKYHYDDSDLRIYENDEGGVGAVISFKK